MTTTTATATATALSKEYMAVENDAMRQTERWAIKAKAEAQGLRLYTVEVRTNDSATGAVNAGSGPSPWKQMAIFAGFDAPLKDVVGELVNVADAVRCGDRTIYSEWVEIREADCAASRIKTEISSQEEAYLRAAYAVSANPLPHFRKLGYRAHYSHRVVTLEEPGLEPLVLHLEGRVDVFSE